MDNDYKKRIEMSILKTNEKALPKESKPYKKRDNPEKRVEHQVLTWCRFHSMDVTVIDSGFHDGERSKVGETGFSDICGNNLEGLAVYIELKAPGKRSTLKEHQYLFLRRKIRSGCFAVCVDSVQLIDSLYKAFLSSPPEKKKALLLAELPEKFNEADSKSLFD